MRAEVLTQLEALPRLAPTENPTSRSRCRICGGVTDLFDCVDFNKYCNVENAHALGWAGLSVPYRRCLVCSYLYTDFFLDWTKEEFSRFIYNDDYALVDHEYEHIRPDHVAADFCERLGGCETARILDYGSGAGVFVTRLIEYGFENIEAYDPFSSPQKPHGLFDIITCFEVIEHEPDPHRIIDDMRSYLAPGGCIVFSQTVQPATILTLRGSWWYLGPRNGHVSTFSEESLLRLGRAHGFELHVGSTVYGLASPDRSLVADLVLTRIGPTLSLVRLLAPSLWPDRAVVSEDGQRVIWHPVEVQDGWRVRWSGHDLLSWEASWRPAEMLEVRIPVSRTTVANVLVDCTVELAAQVQVPTMDRGEWVARFDVAGLDHATIRLRAPPTAAPAIGMGPAILALRMETDPVESPPSVTSARRSPGADS